MWSTLNKSVFPGYSRFVVDKSHSFPTLCNLNSHGLSAGVILNHNGNERYEPRVKVEPMELYSGMLPLFFAVT